MNGMLSDRNTIKLGSGIECTLLGLLGAGTQGEVYRVRLPDQTEFALKWYFPASATPQQRDLLQRLVDAGPPDPRFLWPLELGDLAANSFGYLMELRPKDYVTIADLLTRRVDPSFRALTRVGFELSDGFLQLHARGWCYRDISFGNLFFDPRTGAIRICDNDNAGVNDDSTAAVKGTLGFMAPEIVLNQANPSTYTDLFSLAVLLFYIFVLNHPLEGALEAGIHILDENARVLLYGKKPVFIFDPKDQSNRPVRGYQDNPLIYWGLYPSFLERLFEQSFTVGLRDPAQRVRESQWRQAMVAMRDSVMPCDVCKQENFFDPDLGRPVTDKCWSCHTSLATPKRLRILRQRSPFTEVVLDSTTRLFPHHLNGGGYDFGKRAAEVARHPTNPDLLGLKNLSSENWVVTTHDGRNRDVPPGRSVALADGTTIDFGKVRGEVLA
jgi:serine/threonine protein kinase